jgi:hypothetical protein
MDIDLASFSEDATHSAVGLIQAVGLKDVQAYRSLVAPYLEDPEELFRALGSIGFGLAQQVNRIGNARSGQGWTVAQLLEEVALQLHRREKQEGD